jgi:hypothetical protein
MRADDALATARTGDIWLYRGPSLADRAIRMTTNSPVNHAAMAVALDDLPPLLWHTEMGRALEDVWTGDHHRGAQLNRLEDAFVVWTGKYGQTAYVRQLDTTVTPEMEDELLRVIARFDGRPFPKARSLSWKWIEGRLRRDADQHAIYCAELIAITYRHMGLLDLKRPSNWYDPGKFWSGDHLELAAGATLGGEIEVVS